MISFADQVLLNRSFCNLGISLNTYRFLGRQFPDMAMFACGRYAVVGRLENENTGSNNVIIWRRRRSVPYRGSADLLRHLFVYFATNVSLIRVT